MNRTITAVVAGCCASQPLVAGAIAVTPISTAAPVVLGLTAVAALLVRRARADRG